MRFVERNINKNSLYPRNPLSCSGVDYATLAESHSVSMLPVYLRLSPTCNVNYLEYSRAILDKNGVVYVIDCINNYHAAQS